jgi:hypothetical protein
MLANSVCSLQTSRVDLATASSFKEERIMAKYGRTAQREVKRAVSKQKRGKQHSGKGGAKAKSRKQAIAIGLSKARKKGAKVPRKAKSRR